jgi:hypothetical protein
MNPETGRRLTIWLWIIYPLLPLAWTAIMYHVFGYHATVTGVIREFARAQPIVIAGVTALFTSLIWHWFGRGD